MTDELQLGKYLLHEQLGRGGYGTVYRARDTVLNVERAVKVLHPALLADPEFIERFRREAQLAARLEHPHILPVYDLGESGGSVFLAMKYMPSGSLKDLLAKEGRLPFARALEITRQIAEALDYAHHQPEQLIHRDVKPGNVLFEKDGNIRLTDFGFAKALVSPDSSSLSASGAMIGTPAYMPPEIWMGQSASPATDLYSLACITYEMLTGESLFGGDSPPPLVMKRHFDPLKLPVTWPEGVPAGIAPVLEKALAKEPGDRYSGAGEFAAALAQLLVKKAPPLIQPVQELPKVVVEEKAAGKKPAAELRQAIQQPPRPVIQEKAPTPPRTKLPAWVWALGGLFVLAVIVGSAIIGLAGLLGGAGQTPTPVVSYSPQTPILVITNPTATHYIQPTLAPSPTVPPTVISNPAEITDAKGVTMRLVPAGEFTMGSNNGDGDEQPVHQVVLDSYYMDKYEVTNDLYQACVNAGVCNPPHETSSLSHSYYYGNPQYDNYPVMKVDWVQAKTYCEWRGAHLPTEAEWEKAARGADGRTYPWGNESPNNNLLNYNQNLGDTTEAGKYPGGVSPYGLYDMAGNVWEWVADWYDSSYYSNSPSSNPQGPSSGDGRALRGGSWDYFGNYVRASARLSYGPDYWDFRLGFRCSRSLP